MFQAKKLLDGSIEIVCDGYANDPNFVYVLDCDILKQAVLSCVNKQLPEVGVFFGKNALYQKASSITTSTSEPPNNVYICLISLGNSRTIMVFNTHTDIKFYPVVRHSYIFGTGDVELVKDLIFEEE